MIIDKKKMIKFSEKTLIFSIYALIFSLPFSKSLVEILFCAGLVSWTTKRLLTRDREVPFIKTILPVHSALDIPVSVYMLAGAISMITSVSISLSLEGFFFKLFENVMLFFLVLEVTRDPKNRMVLLLVTITSAFMICADGVFQCFFGKDIMRGYTLYGPAIRASFKNPNDFSGWLLITLFTVLSFAVSPNKSLEDIKLLKGRKIRKTVSAVFLWLLVILLTVCLCLTYSRGAWLAFLLSLFFFGLLKSRKVFVLTVLIMLMMPFMVPSSVRDQAGMIFNPENRSTVIRVKLWKEAISIVHDYPYFGSGLNTYTAIGSVYKMDETTGFYPHNSYLRMAAESGIVGLISFLCIVFYVLSSSLRCLKTLKEGFRKTYLTGVTVGIIAFLMHSFVDTNIHSLQLGMLMWFQFGLAMTLQGKE